MMRLFQKHAVYPSYKLHGDTSNAEPVGQLVVAFRCAVCEGVLGSLSSHLEFSSLLGVPESNSNVVHTGLETFWCTALDFAQNVSSRAAGNGFM